MVVPEKICPAHHHSLDGACVDVLIKNDRVPPFQKGGKNS